MSKQATPIVLTSNEWNTSSVRYMQPKVNDRGGKSVNVISTQTNRSLFISTPLMMTWGISDYTDEKTGESDGKFNMSLVFPNDQYKTAASENFLKKLKEFENQIVDDAVKNSEVWFGEEMTKDVLKHMFFPFLKYTKDKNTKKIDATKPPTIRAKVPNYNGKWDVEIYNTNSELIFPESGNDNLTPMDLIPKQSNVSCILQCGGLWFGGKGWGLTWKLKQCVVKPKEVVTIFGKCHIQLSNDELNTINKDVVISDATEEEDEDEDEEIPTNNATVAAATTEVEDSDAEQEEEEEPEPVKPVKKVVKKVAPVELEVAVAVEEAPKKKVVKKKL